MTHFLCILRARDLKTFRSLTSPSLCCARFSNLVDEHRLSYPLAISCVAVLRSIKRLGPESFSLFLAVLYNKNQGKCKSLLLMLSEASSIVWSEAHWRPMSRGQLRLV